MRQLLTCSRCGRAAFIDLDLPADLCHPCLRALGFRPGRLTERDVAVLDNAAFLVAVDEISWGRRPGGPTAALFPARAEWWGPPS